MNVHEVTGEAVDRINRELETVATIDFDDPEWDTEELVAVWRRTVRAKKEIAAQVARLEDAITQVMDEKVAVVGGVGVEKRGSNRWTGWDNDALRSKVLTWARFDPETGEEVDPATLVERIGLVWNLSGSGARTTALREEVGLDLEDYATRTFRWSLRDGVTPG